MKRVISVSAFPLEWPDGWRRTEPHRRRPSKYQVSFARARDQLTRELRLMGARDVVLSTNVELRRDGLPYANTREPEDPGVAAYWATADGDRRVIACDSWRTVRENVRAVGLAVGCMRGLERTGASEIMARAFTGFAALPAAEQDDPEWWRRELGLVDGPLWVESIEQEYRRRALKVHPDRGGSNEAMSRLNRARQIALAQAEDVGA